MRFTRNFSAAIIKSTLMAVLPNVTKFSIIPVSVVFKAAFLLQILLVVSHPVSACKAGNTSLQFFPIWLQLHAKGQPLSFHLFHKSSTTRED